jgi:hypothetical protein
LNQWIARYAELNRLIISSHEDRSIRIAHHHAEIRTSRQVDYVCHALRSGLHGSGRILSETGESEA